MRAPIAKAEWTLALRRRRLFLLNMGIPLLLVLPLSLGAAPPFHAAAVYAVLFVLFGTMGSAIPLLREGEDGLLRRVILTGYSAPRLLLERTLAGSIVDFLQLFPAAALILALAPDPGVASILLTLGALAGALLAANLVGIWVAALARSIAEGALFASVVSLFLLHASGVFRTPSPGSWGARIESAAPFRPLHRMLLEVVAGTGGAAPTGATIALLVILGLLGLTVACGHALGERISRG